MRWTHGLVLLAATGACSVEDAVAILPGSDRAGYCASGAPTRLVEDGATGREICGGLLASRVFTRALCACGELVVSAPAALDAFQGSQGPGSSGGAGASVGANGGLQVTSELTVSGSLQAGDPGIVLGAALLSIQGELRDAGRLQGASTTVRVGGDAWVAGDVELQELTVGGVLSHPAERRLSVPQPPPRVRREPVGPFAPPCSCDAPEDVGAFVKNHVTAHHNADIGLAVDALADFTGDAALELPCGRFYLTRIHGAGSLLLRVTGRAALLVDGDVDVGGLDVQLGEEAELDLLVAGGVSARGPVRMGSPGFPSRLRVYVAGAFDLDAGDPWNTLPESSELAGNFYLPRASLDLSRRAELSGSVFAQRVAASAGLFIHYDLDVLGLGERCAD